MKKKMEPKLVFTVFFFFFVWFFPLSSCTTFLPSIHVTSDDSVPSDSPNYSRHLQLTSGVGPESLAFDCNNTGPYTGISDGRILRWQGGSSGWTDFAITSPHWNKGCSTSHDLLRENMCGRPLGLQFSKVTCDLYIADAYFGLLIVGPNGGLATPLATTAEGVPFSFTNGLDIDEKNGIIYVTDTSTKFQRRDYYWSIITGDRTGRLLKYDMKRKVVTVLLRGLAFANGVALSKDRTFILVTETPTHRILRFWLHGTKAGTAELFFQLPGSPDNIRRNSRGEFWVALNMLGSRNYGMAMKVSEDGKVLQVLGDRGGDTFSSISEAQENSGSLWVGSVNLPYVGIYKL